MEFNPQGSAERVVVLDGPVRPHPRRNRVWTKAQLEAKAAFTPSHSERLGYRLSLVEEPLWKSNQFRNTPGGWLSTSGFLLTFDEAQQRFEERCKVLRVTPEQIETLDAQPHDAYDEIFYDVPEAAKESLFYVSLDERVKVLQAVIVAA
jgi:hypothetical protein